MNINNDIMQDAPYQRFKLENFYHIQKTNR